MTNTEAQSIIRKLIALGIGQQAAINVVQDTLLETFTDKRNALERFRYQLNAENQENE